MLGGLLAVTQLRALWRSWRKLCGRQKVGKEVAVEVVRGVPLQLPATVVNDTTTDSPPTGTSKEV